MSTAIIIDLVLVAFLALTVFFSAKKGFILSLCSLAAVIVALIGANFIADFLAPKLADTLEPKLAITIQEALDEHAAKLGLSPDSLTAHTAIDSLKEQGGIYEWAGEQLEHVFEADLAEAAAHVAASAASAVAAVLAHSIIFLISFFLVLLAWLLLGHALDLVSRLPVINSLNHLAGGLLGFLKGAVLIWLAAWIACDLIGWITPDMIQQTYLLKLAVEISPFHLLMSA